MRFAVTTVLVFLVLSSYSVASTNGWFMDNDRIELVVDQKGIYLRLGSHTNYDSAIKQAAHFARLDISFPVSVAPNEDNLFIVRGGPFDSERLARKSYARMLAKISSREHKCVLY
jgi:hypothetical protein